MPERTINLSVSGMKCGGCEAAAKKAALEVPGVTDARFDHAAGSGVVTGDADAEAVAAAVSAAGYPAAVAGS